MRHKQHHPVRSLIRSLAPIALLVAPLVASSGCAKRLPLTPEELARVKDQADVNPLRVYTSEKVISIYREDVTLRDYNVDRVIVERADTEKYTKELDKTTAGQILKIEELNGRPLLWVSFDRDCNTPACSYGFVETEDGRYRMITVPPKEGYKPPVSYRKCEQDSRKLSKGRLASLAEANEVYLHKQGSKVLTVDLTVIKVVDTRERGVRTKATGR